MPLRSNSWIYVWIYPYGKVYVRRRWELEYRYEPLHNRAQRPKLHGLCEESSHTVWRTRQYDDQWYIADIHRYFDSTNYVQLNEQLATLGYSMGNKLHLLSGLVAVSAWASWLANLNKPSKSDLEISKHELSLVTLLSWIRAYGVDRKRGSSRGSYSEVNEPYLIQIQKTIKNSASGNGRHDKTCCKPIYLSPCSWVEWRVRVVFLR